MEQIRKLESMIHECHHIVFFGGAGVSTESGIPICKCGGIIKPSVVLYEEPLDSNVIEKSISAIEKADLLIVAGTSLTVYPANSFIHYFHGKYLVVINKEKIQYTIRTDLMIQKNLGDVFSKIKL